MNKKNLLYAFIAILNLGICSVSCSREEPQVGPEEKARREISETLLGSGALDFSEIITGQEVIGIWIMAGDSACTYYRISGLEEGTTSEDWVIDSLSGTWRAFAEMNAWNETEETLSGFRVRFDLNDDIDHISPEVTYYIVTTEDGIPLTISQGAVEYILMEMDEPEEAAAARVREFTRIATRSWWDSVTDFFSDMWDTITDASDAIGNWFVNFFGADNSNYNLGWTASDDFADYANGTILPDMRKGETTDYAAWMGQIYKGREDTRICEMNIPGTHDTYTYYMTGIGLSDATIGRYARTQARDIAGQWNAGVRFFDARLKSLSNAWLDPTKLFRKDWWESSDQERLLGMFHGVFFCAITADQAILEIVNLLKEHPTETAIVTCSFEGDATAADYILARELMDKYADYVVENPTPDITLKECAGKMIVLQFWDRNDTDHDHRVGPYVGTGYDEYNANGYIQFWELAGAPKTRLLYQNRYQCSTTERCTPFWDEKRKLMTDCFEDAAASKGTADNVWSINQASAYVGGISIHMSYAKNANAMNPWTLRYVYEHKSDKLGIIQMDYAGSNDFFDDYRTNGAELPKVIVESNRWQ